MKSLNTQKTFDSIVEGMTLQAERATELLVDADGRRDAYGFALGKSLDNLSEDINKDHTFSQISAACGVKLEEETIEVVDLCQQIYEGMPPNEWGYGLAQTAGSEGLNFPL